MISASNIYLVGPMGVGKTTVGRSLAKSLGMEFVDSDQQIEERTGVSISTIFDIEGEAGFREREAKEIFDVKRTNMSLRPAVGRLRGRMFARPCDITGSSSTCTRRWRCL